MKIKIKKLHPNVIIPKIMTEGAACCDVVATKIEHLSNSKVVVRLGFSTEIPKGYKACIAPRSSFTHKGWVMANSPAQIDSDYRGEWVIKFDSTSFHNLDGTKAVYTPFPYVAGDRVAQIWIERVIPFEFEEVGELSSTERGEGGFGSTNI
jgi:dUTP pyrophosphatase